MNVQPPVKDQLIVLPNLKRSAVETPGDRKPSLVPAGKPHPVRGHVVAVRDTQSHHHHEASQLTYVQAIGEFLGTFLFLFFAFAGAQVANEASANAGESTPSVGTLLYIALAFGFSLAVNAWVFFRISGGLFNPAVTFGLMLIGCLSYIRAAVVLVAQILGAIASAGVVSALFPNVSSGLAVDGTLIPDADCCRNSPSRPVWQKIHRSPAACSLKCF